VLRIVKMRNSERFEKAQQAEAARSVKRSTISIIATYWKPLLGTCVSWFLYDVIDYGLGLYSAQLTNIVKDAGDATTVLNVLVINTIALPSFFFAGWFVNHVGRKQLQVFGLSGMLAAFIAIFAFYDTLTSPNYGWLFIALYCTQLSFDNMGPGATNYVIPGEIFPTPVRATAHSLSASSGKVGAFVGTYAMPYLIPDANSGSDGLLGVRWTMALMAGICVVAIFWTLHFTPNYNAQTLEHLDQLYEDGDEQALTKWLYGEGKKNDSRCCRASCSESGISMRSCQYSFGPDSSLVHT